MRQSEIEMVFRTKDHERATMECLLRMGEEITDLQVTMREMIGAMDSMSSVLISLNMVADGMKVKIDRLTVKDDDVRSTRSITEGN